MYEYHAWVTLSPSLDENDNDYLEMIQKIEKALDLLKDRNSAASLQTLNGGSFVSLLGHFNRANVIEPMLLDTLQKIGLIAPGSYGLLYVRDDENMDGLDNEFQVWRLAKGTVEKQKDQLLSPCIPNIEDEFDISDI